MQAATANAIAMRTGIDTQHSVTAIRRRAFVLIFFSSTSIAIATATSAGATLGIWTESHSHCEPVVAYRQAPTPSSGSVDTKQIQKTSFGRVDVVL